MRYLREEDVEALLRPADASAAAAAALVRRVGVQADVESGMALDGGHLAVAAAADEQLEAASVNVVASFVPEGSCSAALLFARDRPELVAVVELERIRRLAAGATIALAARVLARREARSVGLIGCGALAGAVLECLRTGLTTLEGAVAYCRDERRREAFASRNDCEAAEYGREAAEQDVVVTATTSADPVLRGEWLAEGALVCAAGTSRPGARELDNVVLTRSAFVCCDSLAAGRGSADIAEPVERGVLDWLEVHELADVLALELEGRQSERDIVLVKCAGAPALVLALACLAVSRASG